MSVLRRGIVVCCFFNCVCSHYSLARFDAGHWDFTHLCAGLSISIMARLTDFSDVGSMRDDADNVDPISHCKWCKRTSMHKQTLIHLSHAKPYLCWRRRGGLECSVCTQVLATDAEVREQDRAVVLEKVNADLAGQEWFDAKVSTYESMKNAGGGGKKVQDRTGGKEKITARNSNMQESRQFMGYFYPTKWWMQARSNCEYLSLIIICGCAESYYNSSAKSYYNLSAKFYLSNFQVFEALSLIIICGCAETHDGQKPERARMTSHLHQGRKLAGVLEKDEGPDKTKVYEVWSVGQTSIDRQAELAHSSTTSAEDMNAIHDSANKRVRMQASSKDGIIKISHGLASFKSPGDADADDAIIDAVFRRDQIMNTYKQFIDVSMNVFVYIYRID